MTALAAYSFLEQAAAEARHESRRYWATGGPADTLFPVLPVNWRIRLVDDDAAKLETAIERMRDGRPRR